MMAVVVSAGKASFCKQKEAKKLLLTWVMGDVADNAHDPA